MNGGECHNIARDPAGELLPVVGVPAERHLITLSAL